jgi:hypothetical protein
MFTKRNLVDGKKTCIVCGKKFSTRTRKSDGTWQHFPNKKTCSPKCSEFCHNKKRYQVRRPKLTDKVYKTKSVQVKAKCPYCESIHTVLMDKAPIITPRIYCKQHQWCRDEWEAQDIGAGARTTRHAGAI